MKYEVDFACIPDGLDKSVYFRKNEEMLQPSRDKKHKTFTLSWCLPAKLFIYLPTSSLVQADNEKTTPVCNPTLEVMLSHKTMVRGCHML